MKFKHIITAEVLCIIGFAYGAISNRILQGESSFNSEALAMGLLVGIISTVMYIITFFSCGYLLNKRYFRVPLVRIIRTILIATSFIDTLILMSVVENRHAIPYKYVWVHLLKNIAYSAFIVWKGNRDGKKAQHFNNKKK